MRAACLRLNRLYIPTRYPDAFDQGAPVEQYGEADAHQALTTPRRFWPLLKALSDRPDVEKPERFLDRLLETRGLEIKFVILFGSMAKGNWSLGSDYDILVGLTGTDGASSTACASSTPLSREHRGLSL